MQIELPKRRPSWRRPKSTVQYTIFQISQNMSFSTKNTFFKMTYWEVDRNCQNATLLEEATIDLSVYNLAKFTKHVFAKKKYSKSKRYTVGLIRVPKSDPPWEDQNQVFCIQCLNFLSLVCRPSAGSAINTSIASGPYSLHVKDCTGLE